jgi:hypothetical protein
MPKPKDGSTNNSDDSVQSLASSKPSRRSTAEVEMGSVYGRDSVIEEQRNESITLTQSAAVIKSKVWIPEKYLKEPTGLEDTFKLSFDLTTDAEKYTVMFDKSLTLVDEDKIVIYEKDKKSNKQVIRGIFNAWNAYAWPTFSRPLLLYSSEAYVKYHKQSIAKNPLRMFTKPKPSDPFELFMLDDSYYRIYEGMSNI